ncbi:MAG: Sec-independent protein translocase protein TatB [Erythrobacter sp.]
MFDIGATELLVILIVAILVIGPKDLPLAMRTAGRWIGKVRKISAHFRTGVDAMVREAELDDMEKKWKAKNDAIMQRHPSAAEGGDAPSQMTGPPVAGDPLAEDPAPPPAVKSHKPSTSERPPTASEPELPLSARQQAKPGTEE